MLLPAIIDQLIVESFYQGSLTVVAIAVRAITVLHLFLLADFLLGGLAFVFGLGITHFLLLVFALLEWNILAYLLRNLHQTPFTD